MSFHIRYESPLLFNLRIRKKNYIDLFSVDLGLGFRGTRKAYRLTLAFLFGMVCLFKDCSVFGSWMDADNAFSWHLWPRMNISEIRKTSFRGWCYQTNLYRRI